MMYLQCTRPIDCSVHRSGFYFILFFIFFIRNKSLFFDLLYPKYLILVFLNPNTRLSQTLSISPSIFSSSDESQPQFLAHQLEYFIPEFRAAPFICGPAPFICCPASLICSPAPISSQATLCLSFSLQTIVSIRTAPS
uniref:Uncharacterized protein n=1 Tax=Cacopsylla melanoneura TaxID=428564 RepID=A0A8D9EX44_9HEMI